MSGCDCEPEVHDDESVTHDTTCPKYPWCPHELGGFTCDVPCLCRCAPCAALDPL